MPFDSSSAFSDRLDARSGIGLPPSGVSTSRNPCLMEVVVGVVGTRSGVVE